MKMSEACFDPLLPAVLREVLSRRYPRGPTELQARLWRQTLSSGGGGVELEPSGRSAADLAAIVTAPTGTGKSVAFLVPALASLLAAWQTAGSGEATSAASLDSAGTRSDSLLALGAPVPGQPELLVVAPTRELVVQVSREALALSQLPEPCTEPQPATDEPTVGPVAPLREASREGGGARASWLSVGCLYGGVPPYHQVRARFLICACVLHMRNSTATIAAPVAC